jgi:hypothetical protein
MPTHCSSRPVGMHEKGGLLWRMLQQFCRHVTDLPLPNWTYTVCDVSKKVLELMNAPRWRGIGFEAGEILT